ncbi:hypothetical protein BS17DRAFT_811159 [Gyrodon lividus]|nr:hypothetical protein BS17DRAFT_811159 [Gyrodon lividus]
MLYKLEGEGQGKSPSINFGRLSCKGSKAPDAYASSTHIFSISFSFIMKFGPSTTVALSTLAQGDIIRAPIIIDIDDLVDPTSKTGTTKDIKKGKPITSFCIVSNQNSTHVTVTYLATFDKSTTLPTTLKKPYWYPIDPAKKEGSYVPLPALNERAQWASLRKKQELQLSALPQVPKFTTKVIAESVAKIRGAMKA